MRRLLALTLALVAAALVLALGARAARAGEAADTPQAPEAPEVTGTPEAATAQVAPAAPTAPSAPSAPSARERRALRRDREVRVYRLRAPVITPSPAQIEAYAPEPDSPASPPAVWEWVFPAGPRTYDSRTDTTVKVPRGVTLVLSNIVGDISVAGWKKDAVRIKAKHSKRERVIVRLQRGVLAVEAVHRGGSPPVVEYDLEVPEWMGVRLSSIESDIDVNRMNAPVEAQCIRGDVRAADCRGPLQLGSIEGEVKVVDARDVQATSVNNGVELERVVGQIEVESVNGDIELREVRSPRVVASSIGGSVVFSGAFEPRGHYRLVSHTGNLQVGMPVGAAVDVRVASWNGSFQSALPLQVGRQRRGRQLQFSLGGGGSTLELESFQGLIQLLAPGELPPAQPPKAPKAPRAPQAPARPDEEKDR